MLSQNTKKEVEKKEKEVPQRSRKMVREKYEVISEQKFIVTGACLNEEGTTPIRGIFWGVRQPTRMGSVS